MFSNAYYQQDNKAIYLHLDGGLRLVPDVATFKNLFGKDFLPSDVNQFPSAKQAPFAIRYPIPSGSKVYTLPNDPKTPYFADVFPWAEGRIVLRKIVSASQLLTLGFSTKFTPWTAGPVPSVEVPLAVNTENNWHLQTMLAGSYSVYNYLCGYGPVNPFFATWVKGANKPGTKAKIAETQAQIDQLKGVTKVQAPVFSPPGGVSNYQNLPVTITCATPNVVIYYTTDGTKPIAGPGGSSVYTGKVVLPIGNPATPSIVLTAVAECVDLIGASVPVSANYTYARYVVPNPVFSPASGNRNRKSIEVSIEVPGGNATIYYTTDGTAANPNSLVYRGPFSLNIESPKTVSAIATHNLYGGSSGVSSAQYRYVAAKIEPPPTFSPQESQVITPSIFVEIRSAESDNVLRYSTVVGQSPDNLYSTPVRLPLPGGPAISSTIWAQATNTFGSLPSDVSSKSYSSSVNWTHAWPLSTSAVDILGNVNLEATNVQYDSRYWVNTAEFSGNGILTTTNTGRMRSPVFSVSAWVMIFSVSNSEHYCPVWVFEDIATGNDGPGVLIYEDGRVLAQTIQSNGNYVLAESRPYLCLPGYRFYHLAVVADGKNLNLYVNGFLAAIQAYDGTIATGNCGRFNIGAEKAGASGSGALRHQLSGMVNRVAYTNTALTSAQVVRLLLAEAESRN